MLKKLFLFSLSILLVIIVVGCGKKMPPDCNDDKTKQMVLSIVQDNWVWGNMAKANLNSKYADGKLKAEVVTKHHKELAFYSANKMDKMDAELTLSYVRPERVDKEIGKYLCLAKVTLVSNNYYDSYSDEITRVVDIEYTSEFADGKVHMSSVRQKGDWEQVSFNKREIEPKEETNKVVRSRYGEIKVVKTDGISRVKINDKPVSKLENDFIDLEKHFQFKNADVVLVSLNCGGSSCWYPYYVFLTIKPDSSYSLTEEIHDVDGTVEQKGDSIIMKEKIDYGEGKIVTYSNGSITEKPRVVLTTGTVSEERCKGLFKLYKENCVEGNSFTGVVERNYNNLKYDKRVNEKKFDEMCETVGKTNKPVDYGQFKKRVCTTN